MLRSIQSIRGFGVFEDFRWPPGLPEFKQFNLIYGWNYSGKTTLFRAFRCFEQGRRHDDFANAAVHLKDEDGRAHHLDAPSTAPVLRVFNVDFVRENLFFDSGNATPILALGAEDIAKQEALATKKTARAEVILRKEKNEDKLASMEAALNKNLSSRASMLKSQLAIPNYDKRHFEKDVASVRESHSKHLLNEQTEERYLSVLRATEKKASCPAAEMKLPALAEIEKKAANVLARVVTANSPVSRLKDNPQVESWVKQGRALHEDKTSCQFCGQPLPHDLKTQLAGHFSADYEDLMAALHQLAERIEVELEAKINIDRSADLYADLRGRYVAGVEQLDKLLKAQKDALEDLKGELDSKKTKAFTSMECPKLADYSSPITEVVRAVNEVIEEHNNRTTQFEEQRKEALERLKRHYAARFIDEVGFNDQQMEISRLKSVTYDDADEIGKLDKTIQSLETELSKAAPGAERINELLAAYFGQNDLRIEVSAEKRFQIVRSGVAAKNLSEGEKTAIAFAHFITRVQDGRHPLDGTIVLVDDPISSLDANHLFNTYALIKVQLRACKQLFISTHSFEFFEPHAGLGCGR